MSKHFIKKLYTKCLGEVKVFYKKSKLSITLDQQSEMLKIQIFIVCGNQSLPKYIKAKGMTTCFCLTKGFFRKQKKDLELVFLPDFLRNF